MKAVEPIRDDEWVAAFATWLKEKSERDYVMFMVGIYTGLRISDILPLRVRDIESAHMVLYEKKTDKLKRIILHPHLKKILRDYTAGMKRTDLLFPSRKKGIRGQDIPIRRQRAYEILKEAARELSYPGNVGTHTLRKTFGLRYYKKHKDVAELQEIFNHSDQSETLRYLGIMREKIDKNIYDMDKIKGV